MVELDSLRLRGRADHWSPTQDMQGVGGVPEDGLPPPAGTTKDYQCSPFTDGEVEAQRGETTCSDSQQVAGWDLNLLSEVPFRRCSKKHHGCRRDAQ